MDKSTVVGHRKGSGIGDNPRACVLERWWVVFSVEVCGGIVLCGCGGNLECCVFRTAFKCCAHPNTGGTTFFSRFQHFLCFWLDCLY